MDATTTVIETPVSAVGCINCGQPASRSLACPKCQSLNIKDAVFCSPSCFKDNYSKHKKLHTRLAVPATSSVDYAPGTEDAFQNSFKYSGPLRAMYPIVPVPKRLMPDEIAKPDYATNIKGESFLEKAAGRQIYGEILTKKEQKAMREVCRLGREVLDLAAAAIRPGVTTLDIDAIVHAACIERGSYPSPLGYHHFPRSVCTSVNEVICHGIPDARPLVDGDIVNLDVTLFHNGFHGDLNATCLSALARRPTDPADPVGEKVSPLNLALIATARACLDEAIRVSKPGYLFRDLGELIEATARKGGFSVNKTYCGHGINQLFHCAPSIPHYKGNRATGEMKVGMTFTIEPMICIGHHKELHWPDNWTAVTMDGKPSAQFEETLLVTNTGVEVLTAAKGWKLPKLVVPKLT